MYFLFWINTTVQKFEICKMLTKAAFILPEIQQKL